MSDLISRQAAIDGIKKEMLERDGRFYKGLLVANHVILHLPPAQPERKKGKWIDNDKINFPQCSECGMWIDVMQQSGEMNFCPNCGADMRGEPK